MIYALSVRIWLGNAWVVQWVADRQCGPVADVQGLWEAARPVSTGRTRRMEANVITGGHCLTQTMLHTIKQHHTKMQQYGNSVLHILLYCTWLHGCMATATVGCCMLANALPTYQAWSRLLEAQIMPSFVCRLEGTGGFSGHTGCRRFSFQPNVMQL